MVGNDMKRFAGKNGLMVNRKMVYGIWKGYVIRLRDTWFAGRSVMFSICLENQSALEALNKWLDSAAIKKRYWISSGSAMEYMCIISFQDTLGTMRKIAAFLEIFPDKLRDLGAMGVEVCSECGKPVAPGEGELTVLDQDVSMMHIQCAQEAREQMREEALKKREKGLFQRILDSLRKAS